jgi:hypothetical protein
VPPRKVVLQKPKKVSNIHQKIWRKTPQKTSSWKRIALLRLSSQLKKIKES